MRENQKTLRPRRLRPAISRGYGFAARWVRPGRCACGAATSDRRRDDVDLIIRRAMVQAGLDRAINLNERRCTAEAIAAIRNVLSGFDLPAKLIESRPVHRQAVPAQRSIPVLRQSARYERRPVLFQVFSQSRPHLQNRNVCLSGARRPCALCARSESANALLISAAIRLRL